MFFFYLHFCRKYCSYADGDIHYFQLSRYDKVITRHESMIRPTARSTTDLDFILNAKQRQKQPKPKPRMGKSRAALDDCELMETSLQNRRFTWSN